MNFKLTEFSFG